MATEGILQGKVWRETEFHTIPAGYPNAGTRTNAGCGPNGAAMAACWSLQRYIDRPAYNPDLPPTSATVAMLSEMWTAGLLGAPNGLSQLRHGADGCKRFGCTIAELRDYSEPWPSNQWEGPEGARVNKGWRGFFDRHVTKNIVVLEVAEGHVLVDLITGLGENANTDPNSPSRLKYHILDIVGYHGGGFSARAGKELPVGWWSSDGANRTAGDRLQFYADTTIQSAVPCGAYAVKRSAPVVDTTGLGDGFRKYAEARSLQGRYVPERHEFGYFTYAAWADASTPTQPPGSIVLMYSESQGVHDDRAGWVVYELDKELQRLRTVEKNLVQQIAERVAEAKSLLTQNESLKGTVTLCNSRIADLEDKLEACEGRPTADPLAIAALETIKSLRSLLSQLPEV